MQKRWTGKNVDLDLLSESVEKFLKDKGFVTSRTESEKELTVFWASERAPATSDQVPRVRIIGDSGDFTVEIVASELADRQIRLGLLTKAIGGGYFALRSIRTREKLEKLESELWAYIDSRANSLIGSARR